MFVEQPLVFLGLLNTNRKYIHTEKVSEITGTSIKLLKLKEIYLSLSDFKLLIPEYELIVSWLVSLHPGGGEIKIRLIKCPKLKKKKTGQMIKKNQPN